MKTLFHYFFFVFFLVFSNSSFAQVSMDFEVSEGATGANLQSTGYTSPNSNSSQHILQNTSGPTIIVKLEGSGTILGFENVWSPTGGNAGEGLTNDNFGVATASAIANNNVAGTSAPSGSQAFVMEDIDGDVAMNFEKVDLDGTTNPIVSIKYFIDGSTWELADFIYIHVEITGCGSDVSIPLLDTRGQDIDGNFTEDSWLTLTQNLSAYIGCDAQLIVEHSSNANSEEFLIDDVDFTEGALSQPAPPFVCPTVGTSANSVSDACTGEAFNITATGLSGLDAATNNETDFGVKFVAYPISTTNPYNDLYNNSIDLGTVPFASLIGGGSSASISGVNINMTGDFYVYAILSPSPLDGACLPNGEDQITINGCDGPCSGSQTTSFETIVGQDLQGSCQFVDPNITAHTLENISQACGEVTVKYEGFGNTLGFKCNWNPSSNSTNGDGFADGDNFGVATNESLQFNLQQNASDGSQAFLMEDIDGEVELIFDAVDLTGTTSPTASIDYFISASWDAGDFVQIIFEITDCAGATTITPVDLTSPSTTTNWITLNQDLTAYIGCEVTLKVKASSTESAEELGIDNIIFNQGCRIDPTPPTICPTVASVSASESAVCINENFNITATGLATMDMATNSDQDYGVKFVAFTSTPADPYAGGTDLGTVPFGSLTGGGTTAALLGATLSTSGTHEIYAILSPTPSDMTCRPSAMTSIAVDALPVISIADLTLCIGETTTATPSTGGTWISQDPTRASITNAGIITALVGGNTTFTFTDATTGCNATTSAVSISGIAGSVYIIDDDICVNGTTTVGAVPFPAVNIWSSNDETVATVTNDGDVTGVSAGTTTFTFTQQSNGCTATTSPLTVKENPTATFTAPADLCIDAASVSLSGSGTPSGGTEMFSGPGVTGTSFDPSAAGVGIHTITYTYTATNGCSDTATDDVEVGALPNVNFNIPAAQDTFCIVDGTQVITGGMPVGGTYSGPGVTDDANGTSFTFDPAAAGLGLHILTYTFTDGNGCEGSFNDFISVQPLPTVTFTALGDLCIDAGVQNGQAGGSPVGGVYSGTGVTDDGNGITYSFDPAAAGVSTHTLTYTYTNFAGCTNSADSDVEVFDLPTITFTLPSLDLCIDDAVETGIGGGSPTGGIYSGLGVADDGNGETFSFNPGTSGAGTHTVTYTYVDGNGCSAMATDDIEVAATCNCFLGDNTFTGAIDGDWDKAGNWSLNCIPTSPYVGNLTIMSNVNTSSLSAFELTGNLIIESGAMFEHTNGNDFDVVGSISVLVGGEVRNTSTLTTTLGMTNAGTYSGKGIDGNFTNNGVVNIGGN